MSSSQKKVDEKDAKSVYETVSEYYGRILKHQKDLKTDACCPIGAKPHPILRAAMEKVPKEVMDKFYGCGNPIPLGIEGLHVLDLGSGSGRDCYMAASMVGPNGSVTGIDMTDEQLATARKHVDSFTRDMKYPKPNLRFVKGYIECLSEAGIQDGSMDLIISNCVVNLSPDKLSVLKGVYKALKEGGEFYFSDVYCDRRLPENVRQDPVLYGECLGGALYLQDFYRMCHAVGFADPRIVSANPLKIGDQKLQQVLGNAKFQSITFRLFKISSLESLCEDYGQVATYKGTIPGHEHSYPLDQGHVFITNKPMLVCGNSASLVGESWLAKHFIIQGNRNVHFGLFDCGKPAAAGAPAASGGGCC